MKINDKVEIQDLYTTDLHMHTSYCDGKNSPEEMVQSAIAKGMTCIGFSGHSYVKFDDYCGMKKEQADAYFLEILRLKKKYRDQIKIYCGIEQDYFSETRTSQYDYVIGSLHYLETGTSFAAIDDTPEILDAAVRGFYRGDYYLAAEWYYEKLASIVQKTGADIIGHFDLFSKFNQKVHRFDEQNTRYRAAWQRSADHLLKEKKTFEINTGAISRGWREIPYPAPEMIAYIKNRKGKFLFSSDSHNCENIGFGFRDLSI